MKNFFIVFQFPLLTAISVFVCSKLLLFVWVVMFKRGVKFVVEKKVATTFFLLYWNNSKLETEGPCNNKPKHVRSTISQ